jgi:phage protein D
VAKISMASLAAKYNDFMVPAMKVKAGGFDLIGASEYGVESVDLTLSQSAASAAVIKLTNVYDLEKRSFVSDISDFILGEMIEVEMGYGSSLTSLFYGYVDEINYELSENPSVRVTAVDVRRMMMGSKKSNISHQVKSYSEAFNEVIKVYNPVYKTKDVDPTDKLETDCIIQNGSDYDFIKEELCRKANRDFFVHAGKLYFKDISAELFYTVEMEWAKDFISFQRRASFQDAVIRIMGQDTDKKEEVEAEVKVKSDDKQKKLVKNETTEMDAAVEDNSDAKKIAEHKADEMKKQARQATGVCIGVPEIQPGGRVKIKKGDSKLIDGTYDIIEVKHSFSGDGYRTTFEVGGWKR